MAKMSEVKAKLRKSKQWGFLAEMLGETEMDVPMAGVNHQGVLLINPSLAVELSTADLVRNVRNEFKVAAELRDNVRGFR